MKYSDSKKHHTVFVFTFFKFKKKEVSKLKSVLQAATVTIASWDLHDLALWNRMESSNKDHIGKHSRNLAHPV